MKKAKISLEPQNAAEAAILAEEDFRLDVQYAILDAMERTLTSRRQLAERLGVSEARISQIFSDKCNITVRLLARIFHALNTECSIRVKERSSGTWEQESPCREDNLAARYAAAKFSTKPDAFDNAISGSVASREHRPAA